MRTPLSILVAVMWGVGMARADTGGDHVKVELIADAQTVVSGGSFTVGVRFTIDPGWHIYWTNPGDSGLPTRVTWDLPSGVTVGPTQYPVPTVFRFPGDITNYGYEDQVVLLARIREPGAQPPPSNTAPPRVTVHVDYLVCKDVCLPGRATAELNPGKPVHDWQTIRKWQQKLPAPAPDGLVATYDRRNAPADSAYHVRIDWPAGAAAPLKDVTWLPPLIADFDLDDVRVTTRGRSTELEYSLTSTGRNVRPERAEGLILYKRSDGKSAAFQFPIFPAQPPGSSRASSG